MSQPKLVAKRIRENLVEQKSKLENYLKLLDSENKDIVERDADKLLQHIGLEKEVISELSQLKNILAPLEVMYRNTTEANDGTLAGLKSSIEQLTKDVEKKSTLNRTELTVTLQQIKSDIKETRSRTGYTNKVYATPNTSGMLDLNG